MSPITFRPGKLPPDPARPVLRLARFLDPAWVAAPQHPLLRDWLTAGGTYAMDGNDRFGDCVFAAEAHLIQAVTAYALGTPVVLTVDQVLGEYASVTRFDPARPDTDQGAVLQDALDHWRKHTFAGHQLAAFARVDHLDPEQVTAAIDLFGALVVGVQLPDTAMQQFDAGRPWDVQAGARNLGGHAIHAGWYDRSSGAGPVLEAVTWGRAQPMTWQWWQRYVDEAWALVPTSDWLGPAGTTPSGLDLAGLGREFTALTGEPSPFPDPPPGPVPTPVPGPEIVTQADAALWADVAHWSRRPHLFGAHRVATDLRRWAAAKGLPGR